MPFSFFTALLSLVVFFAGTILTGPQMDRGAVKEKKTYYAPPVFFQYFSFGHDDTLADIFWLRLIQDIDLCAQEFSKVDGLPEELRPLNLNAPSEKRRCDISWAYRMFDITTELAPRFRMPHAVGGLTLSVLLDDIDGATLLFEKAVKAFPTDWPILYRAAYHYMIEVKDFERGAELALQAANNGAPEWLRYTAARLYTEAGRKEFGMQVLKDYLESEDDAKNREAILNKMRELENK